MKLWILLFVFAFFTVGLATDIDQAMVKIYTNSMAWSYYIPWSTEALRESSGSGCVVDGNMILTNAHVVSNETYLQVRKEGDPRKYQASVVAVSHDSDLALITVKDESFFQGIDPLELGELPRPREQVTVYGYPMGGDALSTTQGVISRIESYFYVHSGLSLLTVQIDAAINPGNSGGPAIIDSRIVGVAMQTISQADNIGYVIPVPVIRHFFEDLEDGSYDGFPSAGFSYQVIRNEAFTEMFGIEKEQAGVMVTNIAYGSPAAEVLEPGDVIMEIDGRSIAGDGTVEFRSGSRTRLDYMVHRRQIGEVIPLEVIRDGISTTVEITLNTTLHDLTIVSSKIYDTPPEYFIFGGAVFMPLTLNYLEEWGSDWRMYVYEYFIYPFSFNNWRTEDTEEIVIHTYMLPAEVNTGYENISNEIIRMVDGTPVRSFSQFVELVDSSTGQFLELTTNLGNIIVLDREEAFAVNDEILDRYGIPEDRVVFQEPDI
ncbi:MAG: trypsin-like peptidase domain-containing protein [Candidatus Aegiribacteria sp.]|nr:trypsin-like peptidase domain-containing protein [Candidatus Aegiribacteria sp.]